MSSSRISIPKQRKCASLIPVKVYHVTPVLLYTLGNMYVWSYHMRALFLVFLYCAVHCIIALLNCRRNPRPAYLCDYALIFYAFVRVKCMYMVVNSGLDLAHDLVSYW